MACDGNIDPKSDIDLVTELASTASVDHIIDRTGLPYLSHLMSFIIYAGVPQATWTILFVDNFGFPVT